MKSTFFLACLCTAALDIVAALPGSEGDAANNPASCKGGKFNALRNNPDARPFCESFLHLTVTSTASSSTSTRTVTETPSELTITSTTTITTLAADPATCGPISAGNGPSKRAVAASVTTPSQLSGQPSATISAICSCLNVNPRSTAKHGKPAQTAVVTTTITADVASTTTVTATETSAQPTPTNLSGLSYYAYSNNYDFSQTPNIDVTSFESNNYEVAGTAAQPVAVAPGSAAQCTMPGANKAINCLQVTVVMQGYFLASSSGQYTFTTGGDSAAQVDNYVGLWTGPSAYNYGNSNADFIAIREFGKEVGGSVVHSLDEGDLLPVTIIYMNGGYQGNFAFEVITPDGTTHADTTGFWFPACANSPFTP